MKIAKAIASALGVATTAACSIAVAASTTTSYAIVDRIPGTGKQWDYAIVDSPRERLYLAQQGIMKIRA